MNKEMMNRMREARKYQKMAIRALMPVRMAEHVDVIENEVKAMVRETIIDVVKDRVWDNFNEKSQETTASQEKESKVKKVTID